MSGRLARSPIVIVAAAAVAVVLSGCSGGSDDSTGDGSSTPASSIPAPSAHSSGATKSIQPPPAAGIFDYQIGGAYPPAANVTIVDRDRSAQPVPGHYNVCYVNAFQTQRETTDSFNRDHPELLVRKDNGSTSTKDLIMDTEWDEALFDISTAAKRQQLLDIVGPWIDGCASAGFQAVEADNLDSWTRSGGKLTADDAAAFATLLTARAHRAHLAFGQKNAAELLPRAAAIGFDFAVVEECQEFDECGDFTAVYGRRVIEIEYQAAQFSAACRARRGQISIIQRDHDVTPPTDPAHLQTNC